MGWRVPKGEVPEEIRLVNEFLNTLDLERFGEHAGKPEEGRDELGSVEGLKGWLVSRGLLEKGETATEADRALAVTVRGALRRAAWANGNRESAADGRSLDAAQRVFGELPLVFRLSADGSPRLAPGRGGVRGALGWILADVAVAAARGTWARLKICNAGDCRWVYYDHSKSRTGRWCSMRTCGNRVKTRKYRRRKAAEGGA